MGAVCFSPSPQANDPESEALVAKPQRTRQGPWQGYEHQLLSDRQARSFELPNSSVAGATNIFRHPSAPEGWAGCLPDEDEKGELDTAWKLFQRASKKFAENTFTGVRSFNEALSDPTDRGEYSWMTYQQVYERVLAVGNGMASLDFEPKSNVGIFASNRPEWLFIHFGNLSQSYRTVALYDTLGADAVSFIITHAQLPIIFVEKAHIGALFDAIAQIQIMSSTSAINPDKGLKLDSQDDPLLLRYIVQIDVDASFGNLHEGIDRAAIERAEGFGIQLLGLSELMGHSKGESKIVPPEPDDLAYIMYTSGTTGRPKGVELSHYGIATIVASLWRNFPIRESDRHISYLPLAHIFETNAIACFLNGGAEVGFFNGDLRRVSQDFKDLHPTILLGVPRVFSKTYDKFKLKVSQGSTFKQMMIGRAEVTSQTTVRQGQRSTMWDKLVWSKVAPEIGFDRVRLIVSGAAPLSPYLAEFLRIICPNAAVIQGYGMTETTAGGTTVQKEDTNLGHVGVPVDNIELRLVDAPECSYMVSDTPYPRGEVQFRGPCIMLGYYRNVEATEKVVSEDGWLSTGDIGRLNPNGTLSIIDRRKNIFKTAQGEYIAAERLEQIYGKSNLINQIWIYGNSYKSFVVAVVVPDALVFVEIFKSNGWWPSHDVGEPTSDSWNGGFASVCRDHYAEMRQMILDSMKDFEGELNRFERVKDIMLEVEIDHLLQGFCISNDCLTPTQKLRRPQLLNRYSVELKEIYATNGEPPLDHETWGN